MSHRKATPPSQDELLQNYKPLGLKAVVAAHEIRLKSEPAPVPAAPIYARLPEGFHVPPELD